VPRRQRVPAVGVHRFEPRMNEAQFILGDHWTL
jgi:hypothetical protein